MKKIFSVLFILLTLTFGFFYLTKSNKYSESLDYSFNRQRTFPSHKRDKAPETNMNKKIHHYHDHHYGKRAPSAISSQSSTPNKENKRLQKKYNSQIKAFKKSHMRFLSKGRRVEVLPQKETKFGLVVQVKNFNEEKKVGSFTAILNKESGKVISTQGFTIHENKAKKHNHYFSPSGAGLNE